MNNRKKKKSKFDINKLLFLHFSKRVYIRVANSQGGQLIHFMEMCILS